MCRSVTRSYYRGAAGALLVYDITRRDTFNELTHWISDTRTLASPDIVIILVGNKVDLDKKREVGYVEASRFAHENGLLIARMTTIYSDLIFLETSAMTGIGVEETFLKCARSILTKIETGVIDPEKVGSGIQYGNSTLHNMNISSMGQEQRWCCN